MTPPEITIRPFCEADRPFYRALMARLVPLATASPRAPGTLAAYLDERASGMKPYPEGTTIMVAVDPATGERLGLVAYRPEREYFAGHPQVYVELLAVTAAAAGRGIGYALMRHVEDWGIAHGCHEIALDVFAANAGAIQFYERFGFTPDHLRLSKPLPGAAATGVTVE